MQYAKKLQITSLSCTITITSQRKNGMPKFAEYPAISIVTLAWINASVTGCLSWTNTNDTRGIHNAPPINSRPHLSTHCGEPLQYHLDAEFMGGNWLNYPLN